MFEVLFYSGILCPDADAIMLRIQNHEGLKPKVKIELVETVKEATPECSWDAND